MPRYRAIFNPVAGRRHNRQRAEELVARFGAELELCPTSAPGDATSLARDAADAGREAVFAIGGDGTVHETAVGLLESRNLDTALVVVPVGSANDYAHQLRHEFGADAVWPAPAIRADVGRVTCPGHPAAWFINSLGLGFSGAVTAESRAIRRLRGVLLYGLGTIRAMVRHFHVDDWEVKVDDLPTEVWPTLMLSLMIGRREGNFIMAPDARLADGQFEFVHAGRVSRWDILRLLPSLARSGPPQNYPGVRTGRCTQLTIRSSRPFAAHVDGEVLCRPDHGCDEAIIELVPRRLAVCLFES